MKKGGFESVHERNLLRLMQKKERLLAEKEKFDEKVRAYQEEINGVDTQIKRLEDMYKRVVKKEAEAQKEKDLYNSYLTGKSEKETPQKEEIETQEAAPYGYGG